MADPTEVQPAFHPRRSPKHDKQGRGNKGQIWGGECNRTRCECNGAEWFNRQTYAYYCSSCAAAINTHSADGHFCILVNKQLTLHEMAFTNAENDIDFIATLIDGKG